MANEISLSLALSVTKSGATVSLVKSGFEDMAGDNFGGIAQNIGTVAEALATGDVAFPCGILAVLNQEDPEGDPLNILTITEPTNDEVLSVLNPGEWCLLRAVSEAPEGAFSEATGVAQIICLEP